MAVRSPVAPARGGRTCATRTTPASRVDGNRRQAGSTACSARPAAAGRNPCASKWRGDAPGENLTRRLRHPGTGHRSRRGGATADRAASSPCAPAPRRGARSLCARSASGGRRPRAPGRRRRGADRRRGRGPRRPPPGRPRGRRPGAAPRRPGDPGRRWPGAAPHHARSHTEPAIDPGLATRSAAPAPQDEEGGRQHHPAGPETAVRTVGRPDADRHQRGSGVADRPPSGTGGAPPYLTEGRLDGHG